MILLRKLLFPFAILYGMITAIRNFLYDKGILKSYSFSIPIIAVGNLSMGGTGKSPQIEYLIRLLSEHYKIATLSRGYKRKSQGFVLADANASADVLGDEPFQFYSKFGIFKQAVEGSNPSAITIQVAVDANRKNGIEQLLAQNHKPEIILLDDAFQHRKVKAGFYIMLTSFGDLYADDFMLPTGNLREGRHGAKRANVIVVTKCPSNLSVEKQQKIRKKLRLRNHQQLFFSFIDYDDFVYSENQKIPVSQLKSEEKLLLAGIAKPKPFFDYLKSENDVILEFPDHHHFSESEILDIRNKAQTKKIVTTEKDYVRLIDSNLSDQLYYLPIKSSFISDKENFDQTIFDYVKGWDKK